MRFVLRVFGFARTAHAVAVAVPHHASWAATLSPLFLPDYKWLICLYNRVTQDLYERKERVLGQLVRLHPSRSRDVVAGIVAENPELLYRMEYYTHVTLIDELPLEIQVGANRKAARERATCYEWTVPCRAAEYTTTMC